MALRADLGEIEEERNFLDGLHRVEISDSLVVSQVHENREFDATQSRREQGYFYGGWPKKIVSLLSVATARTRQLTSAQEDLYS